MTNIEGWIRVLHLDIRGFQLLLRRLIVCFAVTPGRIQHHAHFHPPFTRGDERFQEGRIREEKHLHPNRFPSRSNGAKQRHRRIVRKHNQTMSHSSSQSSRTSVILSEAKDLSSIIRYRQSLRLLTTNSRLPTSSSPS